MSRAVLTERQTYRRRRLMDIARLLPVLGALLFAVPLLWPDPDPYPAPDVPAGMPMSAAITYVFVIWALLIAAGFGFGLAVKHWAAHWTGGGPDGGSGAPGAADEAAGPGSEAHGPQRRQAGAGGKKDGTVTADALPEIREEPAMPGRAGTVS
ncbi:hypothetical protein [Cribrihabitans neustonicus]|uniref:hypothetical protein n=1 Tax=Cribrihabitans neustonicus TaxID=1429085 RepID=UPI003B5A2207